MTITGSTGYNDTGALGAVEWDGRPSGSYTYVIGTKKDEARTVKFEKAAAAPATGGGSSGAVLTTVYNAANPLSATVWLAGSGLFGNDLLITEALSSGADHNAMLKLADADDIFKIYNIYLRSGQKSTGSAMYITFDLAQKYAGQAFTLVHKKADGTLEYLYATAGADGNLTFGPIYELSPFMLVKGTLASGINLELPKTGDMAAPALWLGLAGLGAAAYALSRRRRES